MNTTSPTIPNSIFDQVTVAMGSHRQWKQRLQAAIQTGQSAFTPARIGVDHQCDFSRWLHQLPPATKGTEHWREVQRLHAAFHQEAGRVLGLALQGAQAEAAQRLAFGGPFASASAGLTSAMMKWKTASAAA